jgi:hypothetical protein
MSREENRKPGRSFDDPSKSMGTGVVKRGATDDDVANRAKAVSVLRKAEEFLAHADPADPRRALELAAGRIGLKWNEYRKLVDGDPELMELERKFHTVH